MKTRRVIGRRIVAVHQGMSKCSGDDISPQTDSTEQKVKQMQSTTPPQNGASIRVRLNLEKNGVEIYFPDKPDAIVRTRLKSQGFKWSNFNKCWYARASHWSIQTAGTFAGLSTEETAKILKQHQDALGRIPCSSPEHGMEVAAGIA